MFTDFVTILFCTQWNKNVVFFNVQNTSRHVRGQSWHAQRRRTWPWSKCQLCIELVVHWKEFIGSMYTWRDAFCTLKNTTFLFHCVQNKMVTKSVNMFLFYCTENTSFPMRFSLVKNDTFFAFRNATKMPRFQALLSI